jgi:4-hydroxyphenylacetate 3-monooxygenase
MPIRRGKEYLESLRDGRRVWLLGQKVEDVTTHPALAGCAHSVAAVYDLQHDPAHQELLTMPSPTTGERVSLAYLLPRSVDELARQRRMYEYLVRRAGGVAARLPQHLATVVIGLYDVRDLLGQVDPAFATHVTRFVEYCREHDVSIATIFSDPLRHRSHPTTAQEHLRVVERRPDGLIVRGARGVGTQAPYANELLCLTSPRPDLKAEEVVFFATPVNAAGIHLVCRQPFMPPNPEDHPLSPYWDEMDAIVVFDEVFIPWQRVFYLRRSHPADLAFEGQVFQGAIGLGPWYVLVRMAVKAEVLLGLCAAITDTLGTANQPLVQMALADAMVYLETLRALIQTAEANPVLSPSGLARPNPTTALAARICAIERYPHLLQTIRELCGSGLLMAPGQAELNHPEIGPLLHRYVVGQDKGDPEYFRLLKLAWEYACDAFGSRQLLFEMYNVSSLATNKQRLASAYDTAPFAALARELAGMHGQDDHTASPALPDEVSGAPSQHVEVGCEKTSTQAPRRAAC